MESAPPPPPALPSVIAAKPAPYRYFDIQHPVGMIYSLIYFSCSETHRPRRTIFLILQDRLMSSSGLSCQVVEIHNFDSDSEDFEALEDERQHRALAFRYLSRKCVGLAWKRNKNVELVDLVQDLAY